MSTSFLNTSNLNHSSMDMGEEEEDYNNPLGIGTSANRTLGGVRPLTIEELLSTKPIKFVAAQRLNQMEEIPYKAINDRPQAQNGTVLDTTTRPISPPVPSTSKLPPPPSPSTNPAFFPIIDSAVSWPKKYRVGRGLENLGNTCFLNSALQVLLHTAPLVRYVSSVKHDRSTCGWYQKKQFCMTCSMGLLVSASFNSERSGPYSPSIVTSNIRKIASNLRLGRQEDAHEFLRFCIDNMQLGCLFGKSPKLPQAVKDSTFVHQIFGGRLRSRVTCRVCSHPSDTFDSILDLSLDVNKAGSIKEALNTFIKIDELKGANKYKCEKCKKLVVAEKSFTIEEAPMVLTIHLKRFTATGRKISGVVSYTDALQLGPYMSDRSKNPSYRLYGIINHSGGGPHSGHYTAHVKSASGQWNHMNDSSVSSEGRTPVNSKNAYILFYCREQGDQLNAAIYGGTSAANVMVNGNGKRSRDSEGGSVAVERSNYHGNQSPAAKKPFIGPSYPSNSPRPPTVLSVTSPKSPNSYQNPFATSNGNSQQQQQHQKKKQFQSNQVQSGKTKYTTIDRLQPRQHNVPKILTA